MLTSRPSVVGIGGLSSNTGKTTLMCELLQAFPGWEAIKTTRGHYRSCGKDPQSCCVSHLLSEQAVVRSGFEETYEKGKDTGRYWDAGALNVHWVIITEKQVSQGIQEALKRVRSNGVFVEGNSFSDFVDVDLMLMVARADRENIKNSARRALAKSSSLYLSGDPTEEDRKRFNSWLGSLNIPGYAPGFSMLSGADLPELITNIQCVLSSATSLIALTI